MITTNQDLTPFNTFGIQANAASFARFSSVSELRSCLHGNEFKDLLILGGGSNVLFTQDQNKALEEMVETLEEKVQKIMQKLAATA